MSLDGLGSKHVYLIIAQTGLQGPVLYKGDKGVTDAACQPESSLAEVGGLTVSSLPLLDGARTNGLATD